MNKLILIGAILILSLGVEAQALKERDVPSDITASLSALYPNASKVKWEKEDGMYEGSFYTGKKETSLIFSRDGILVQTENEIESSDLPAGVVEYITKHHPSAAIKEATKVTDSFGEVNYEVEVAGIDYLFSNSGQFLRQEKEDVDDDRK